MMVTTITIKTIILTKTPIFVFARLLNFLKIGFSANVLGFRFSVTSSITGWLLSTAIDCNCNLFPHCSQNRASSVFSIPHLKQIFLNSNFLPQLWQNLAISIFSVPQFSQSIAIAPLQFSFYFI